MVPPPKTLQPVLSKSNLNLKLNLNLSLNLNKKLNHEIKSSTSNPNITTHWVSPGQIPDMSSLLDFPTILGQRGSAGKVGPVSQQPTSGEVAAIRQ